MVVKNLKFLSRNCEVGTVFASIGIGTTAQKKTGLPCRVIRFCLDRVSGLKSQKLLLASPIHLNGLCISALGVV